MSRLLDPTVCPDCRAALDPAARCTGCGLRLQGPLAAALWTTLSSADRMVEQLRAVPEPVRQAAPAPVAVEVRPRPAAPAPGALPPVPAPVPARSGRRLPAASVPVVLLSLGGLCLLVAAVVFAAVAWGLLGATGRTLVLLGVTVAVAVGGTQVARRDLRMAAETLWLVVAGLLTVDLLAGRGAGLLGLDTLGGRGTGAVVGSALLACGVVVGLWVRTQPVQRSYAAQGVAVLGAALATLAAGWLAGDQAVGTAVALPLLLLLLLALRCRLVVTAHGAGVLAAISWLVLLGLGLARAGEPVTRATWWGHLQGWPLLVAALAAAVVVHAPRVPLAARAVAAGLAQLPLVVLAVGPATPGAATGDALVLAATVLVLGLVAGLAPRPWSWGAGPLAAVGALWLVLEVVAAPWRPLHRLAADADPGTLLPAVAHRPAAWTLVLLALVAAVVLRCLVRLVPGAERPTTSRTVSVLAPALVALGALGAVLAVTPPLWTAVSAGAVAAAVAGGAAWWSRDRLLPAAAGSLAAAFLTLVPLYAAAGAPLLLAPATTVLALTLAAASALRDRAGAVPSAATTAALATLAGGWSVLAWGELPGATTGTRTLLLAAYAVLVALLAAPLTRNPGSRLAVEGSALVLALAAAAHAPDEAGRALVLTLAALGAALLTALHRDRVVAAWLATAALTVATLLRLDAALRLPALFVLPVAVLLVVVGLLRRRRDASSGDLVLGAALALGYVVAGTLLVDRRDDLAAVVLATTVTLAAIALAAHLERVRAAVTAPAAYVLGGLGGAVALARGAELLDLGATASVLALTVYAGAVVVAAAYVTRQPVSRLALEATALALAVTALAGSRVWAPQWSVLAMVLTVLGTAVTVLAVTTRDRRWAGWVGALVLGAATLVRLDAGIPAPEVHTLPAAALLVGAGLWRLRTDREATSLDVLGSGVTLALVPSLLLALGEPVSLRGALVAAGGVAALAVGVRWRLSAPFAAGALTTGLLALRHLGPVAEAVPRWISLGLVGLALLLVGITWEARRRDLHTAGRYLAALR